MTPIEKIKYVKEKANIVDVIGHFVPLKRDGASYKGISPFSNERNPSFTVNPIKNIFKCFSTGKGGDCIDFVMAIKSIPNREALQWIIDFMNIPPSDNDWQITPFIDLPISYCTENMLASTMRFGLDANNNFYKWLIKLFDQPTANELALKYNIGTSKHWQGANIFWQVDVNGAIRGGKIMLYNSDTGKRVKEPEAKITWVHRAARMKDYNLSQCLYGEHLLNTRPDAIVKIVESEKTAIIASVIYPEFIWLASGSLTNLSVARCMPLTGRTISLIPDCGAEQQWIDKCASLRSLIKADWVVDCITGNNPKGYDLCDYILDNLI